MLKDNNQRSLIKNDGLYNIVLYVALCQASDRILSLEQALKKRPSVLL